MVQVTLNTKFDRHNDSFFADATVRDVFEQFDTEFFPREYICNGTTLMNEHLDESIETFAANDKIRISAVPKSANG